MITTDTSPTSSMAICHPERGGCGWRAGPFVTREKAKGAGNKHREQEHGEQDTDARRKARAQGLVTA
jgi:hypothetical protein